MSGRDPSKDDALEALDFIVNVLKEHEKDLDRLINELGNITERLGETGELSGKIGNVEDRLATLQSEITNLISYLSPLQESSEVLVHQEKKIGAQTLGRIVGSPVIIRCKQWEDFQTLAYEANTLSFLYKESEKTIQVDGLKDNQIITYTGDLPEPTLLLKNWLSKQLNISAKNILEGVLAIG